MSYLVLDIETNAIIAPDKLWCIVTQDIDTGKVKDYVGERCKDLLRDVHHTDTLIGHNIISYDMPHLSRLLDGFNHPNTMVIDTLVLARLYNFNLRGRHSLEAWGERLGQPKQEHKEWDKFSPEMLSRCKTDVSLTVKLYKYLTAKLSHSRWDKAKQIEHKMVWFSEEMTHNGFFFDRKAAKKIHSIVVKEKDKLDGRLQNIFRPTTKLTREVTPRETAHGTLHGGDFRWLNQDYPDLTPYRAGGTFSRFSWVPFNPQSPRQIIDRVHKIGWSPVEKTKGHQQLMRKVRERRLRRHLAPTSEQLTKMAHYQKYGWKMNDINLSTINADAPEEAQLLVRRLLLGNRTSVIQSWFDAFNAQTGKIHGSFYPLGCWTHRMAHRNPNMGNIPRSDTEFGADMRKLWTSGPSDILVGCDASGIQLRILAHYINNNDFTHTVTTGTNDNKDDIHWRNGDLLGVDRERAKRWIYAWLLGAGPDKLAHLCSVTRGEAIDFTDQFMDRYEGLRELKEGLVKTDAARGYFEGLDGRWVVCPSEHHMMSGYLQNGEALVMKYATLRWQLALRTRHIEVWPCNLVHDEWQTRCREQDAETVGKIQCAALRYTGEALNMRCPLDGAYKIGQTWYDTH